MASVQYYKLVLIFLGTSQKKTPLPQSVSRNRSMYVGQHIAPRLCAIMVCALDKRPAVNKAQLRNGGNVKHFMAPFGAMGNLMNVCFQVIQCPGVIA
jgi:hypothetical protein